MERPGGGRGEDSPPDGLAPIVFVGADCGRRQTGNVLGSAHPHRRGLIAEADRIARQELEAGNTSPVLRVELAALAALQKDTNAAVESLQRAYDGRYRDYDFLDRDPSFRAGARGKRGQT